MANTPEERTHWKQVTSSYDGYMQYHVCLPAFFCTLILQDINGQLSANHARRTAFLALPKEQREIYDSVGYREKLEAVDEGIRRYVYSSSRCL